MLRFPAVEGLFHFKKRTAESAAPYPWHLPHGPHKPSDGKRALRASASASNNLRGNRIPFVLGKIADSLQASPAASILIPAWQQRSHLVFEVEAYMGGFSGVIAETPPHL
jgi:hypothetical protein